MNRAKKINQARRSKGKTTGRAILSRKKGGGYKASNRMPKRSLSKTPVRPKRGAKITKPFIRTKTRGRYA